MEISKYSIETYFNQNKHQNNLLQLPLVQYLYAFSIKIFLFMFFTIPKAMVLGY